MKKFTISAFFKHAWDSYKKNPWFFLAITAVIFSAQIFANMLEQAVGDQVIAPLASFIGAVVTSIVSIGVVRALLRFVDGKSVGADGVIPPVQQVLWYIVFQIIIIIITIMTTFMIVVVATMVIVGMQLSTMEAMMDALQAQEWYSFWTMIVPHISILFGALVIAFGVITYINIRFFFTTYVIVDKNVNTFKAMRASSVLTKGYKLRIFVLTCMLALINILGALFFMVGLLITIPVSMMVITYAYRQRHDAIAQYFIHKPHSDVSSVIHTEKSDAQEELEKSESVSSQSMTDKEKVQKSSDDEA